jgi:RNA polymerase sigma factor (sigma-70 family)
MASLNPTSRGLRSSRRGEPGHRSPVASATSPLAQYLQEIGRYPVLTRAEEQDLLKRLASRGDGSIRECLVLAKLRLAVSVAHRYARRGVDVMDLIEEGNLGLINAASRFDPTRGLRFATYATWWVRKAVQRAVRSSCGAIRLPGYMVAAIGEAKPLEQTLTDELGHRPSGREVARRLDLSPARARLLRRYLHAFSFSTDARRDLGTGRSEPLADILSDPDAAPPDEKVFGTIEVAALENLLATIDEREGRILSLRFGLSGDGPRSLRQVATVVGMSREGVRRAEIRALRKLREAMQQMGFG